MDRGRHTGQQPTTSAADDHDVHVRGIFDNLQSHGSGAGDDHRVVERVDERQRTLPLYLLHGGE
jgi:hypothetical protein